MNVLMLAAQGQYVALDSALSLVAGDARRDNLTRSASWRSIYGLDRLRLPAPNGPRRRLTIWADLTVALWRRGEFEAALALERIWDELTRPLPFSTVCGYTDRLLRALRSRPSLSDTLRRAQRSHRRPRAAPRINHPG